uniref:Uncharacterized protein n=1 Tax=Arundo donax TaxID=35708 RepID=A0A0A9GCY3_ARUDO
MPAAGSAWDSWIRAAAVALAWRRRCGDDSSRGSATAVTISGTRALQRQRCVQCSGGVARAGACATLVPVLGDPEWRHGVRAWWPGTEVVVMPARRARVGAIAATAALARWPGTAVRRRVHRQASTTGGAVVGGHFAPPGQQ